MPMPATAYLPHTFLPPPVKCKQDFSILHAYPFMPLPHTCYLPVSSLLPPGLVVWKGQGVPYLPTTTTYHPMPLPLKTLLFSFYLCIFCLTPPPYLPTTTTMPLCLPTCVCALLSAPPLPSTTYHASFFSNMLVSSPMACLHYLPATYLPAVPHGIPHHHTPPTYVADRTVSGWLGWCVCG